MSKRRQQMYETEKPVRNVNYKPRNKTHAHALDQWHDNDVYFLIGPAGTGKTMLSVALALQQLFRYGEESRILVTRPARSIGPGQGFLPGSEKLKMSPYIMPFLQSLMKVSLSKPEHVFDARAMDYLQGWTIGPEMWPVAIMDEAQNATLEELKMFLTRLGEGGKMIICGDPTQTVTCNSGLMDLVDKVHYSNGVDGVKVFEFDERYVCRHRVVRWAINNL